MPTPMLIETTYGFGDVVYLRVRAERVAGMVTSLSCREGSTTYGVTWGDTGCELTHADYELVDDFSPEFSRD